jgi:hypothetical protein
MPFDPIPDLTKPSVRALSYVLRHREHWPADFQWNYGCHAHCAIGLAAQVWVGKTWFTAGEAAGRLKMSHVAARLIFLRMSGDTTPEDVANELDKYLDWERTRHESARLRALADRSDETAASGDSRAG